MKLTITGHRPENLHDIQWVVEQMEDVLGFLKPDLLIQGMASGADLLSAVSAYKLGIAYKAVRPWATHCPRVEEKDLYDSVLKNAHVVVCSSPDTTYSGPHLYHVRNKYMVDEGDMVLAIWNGVKKGGTWNAVNYARSLGKDIIVINPTSQEVYNDNPVSLF